MLNKFYNRILFLLYLILFISCHNDQSEIRLKYALEFAGNNRIELEQVLDHYKNDPVKLEAARFLISNMPKYYTLVHPTLETAKEYLILAYKRNHDLSRQELTIGNSFHSAPVEKIYDAQVITAGYLIENIELAFEQWEKRPWNKYLSFDDFCQYVLPYRIDTEPLENWRKQYLDRYEAVLDSIYQGTDVIEASSLLNLYIAENEEIKFNVDFHYFNPGPSFYMDYKIGDCTGLKNVSLYILRSLGIAAACDFYICSPSLTNAPHAWISIKDTTGLSVSCAYLGESMQRNVYVGYQKGKVYRHLFGINDHISSNFFQKNNVPDFFKNLYIKDVTNEHFTANELTVQLENTTGQKFAYLGVQTFHRTKLIDIAAVKGDKATFKNVEPGLIYQLFYSNDDQLIPAGYPVLFDGQNARTFKPDFTHTGHYIMYRKFQMHDWLHSHINYLIGGKLEASKTVDFRNPELIMYFQDSIHNRIRQYIYPSPATTYKYIRYTAPDHRPALLSDILLYTKSDTLQPIKISVTGDTPAQAYRNGQLENILDGDPLTYYQSEKKGGQFIIEQESNDTIYKIEIIPRTDDNFIRPGDRYELFYHNGSAGWVSLGKQYAKEDYLTFDGVPDNALLWLYDSTRGNEEQVFYFHKGKQIFTGREPGQATLF